MYYKNNKLIIKYTDNTTHKIKFNNKYKLCDKNGILINKCGLVPFTIHPCTGEMCIYDNLKNK